MSTLCRWNSVLGSSLTGVSFLAAAVLPFLKSQEYPLLGWYREHALASSNADCKWCTADNYNKNVNILLQPKFLYSMSILILTNRELTTDAKSGAW